MTNFTNVNSQLRYFILCIILFFFLKHLNIPCFVLFFFLINSGQGNKTPIHCNFAAGAKKKDIKEGGFFVRCSLVFKIRDVFLT